MKKMLLRLIDYTIWILCFLFLISTVFKIISLTEFEIFIYNDLCLLIAMWLGSVVFALIFTPRLYHWILHFRYQKQY